MEQIKKLFQNWDISRIIRLVLAVAFAVGYFVSKESMYLLQQYFWAHKQCLISVVRVEVAVQLQLKRTNR